MEFTPPEGVVPEGTTSGEDFDLVCTFRLKDGGTVCIIKAGDMEMPGYDDRSESKPSYETYTKPMMETPMGEQA